MPTIVEMFGLKKPLPTISRPSPRFRGPLGQGELPSAIKIPPMKTALRWPR